MKKMRGIIFLLFLALAVICMMSGPPQAQAAATLVENGITDYRGFSIHDLTLTMTSIGAAPMTYEVNGIVIAVETDPGTTAPTDNYDLTITNARGADIMGTALNNRDTANTEIACPTLGYASEVPTFGLLTINATGNTVNNATVRLRIFTREEKKGILSW